jgi:hypothetical protein
MNDKELLDWLYADIDEVIDMCGAEQEANHE